MDVESGAKFSKRSACKQDARNAYPACQPDTHPGSVHHTETNRQASLLRHQTRDAVPQGAVVSGVAGLVEALVDLESGNT